MPWGWGSWVGGHEELGGPFKLPAKPTRAKSSKRRTADRRRRKAR